MRTTCIVAAVLASFAARAEAPTPASGTFVSRNYALTFQAPAGLTYCRLPEGWTGSDHGTVLFLVPPAACGSTGYPSSSRGFVPDAVPRIEVYYGLDAGEDVRPACHAVAQIYLLGRNRPLCFQGGRDLPAVEVRALYQADSVAEVILTLVTARTRYRHDFRTFRALAASVGVCSILWQDVSGQGRIMGWGRRCPAEGSFY